MGRRNQKSEKWLWMTKCPEEIKGGTVEKGWKMKEEIHFNGGEDLKIAERGLSSPKSWKVGQLWSWITENW